VNLSRKIARHLQVFRVRLLVLVGLSFLATPIALAMPLPLKIVVDGVLGSEPLPPFLLVLVPSGLAETSRGMLIVALTLLLLVTLLNLVHAQGSWILSEYTGEQMVLRLRSQMFEQVQRLSLAYHSRDGLADATYRIQYDAPAIYRLVVWGILPMITALFSVAGMTIVTAMISPKLALVALTISPIVVVLTWIYSRQLRHQWERVKDLETSALAVLQEVLGAIRVVTAFRQEERELDRFVRKSSSGVSERIRVISKESTLTLLIGITFGVGTLFVLLIGVGEVQSGVMTLGSLLLVMSYLGQLYAPLQTLGRQIVSHQGSLVSVRRAFELLEEAPAVVEHDDPQPLDRAQGTVRFSDVSFAYPDGPRVLDGVSFEVPAGARVGITGPTGSGKTTIMGLLTRFYDPDEGEILLDGLDIRRYRLADLRNQFAIVLQEPVLFSTSIAANIAYARPEASFDQIVAAAKAAGAHDFIERLPDGYRTDVGDRGALLSGGERQRISIARAFLKDAPVLIMDEPTSSVDTVTEEAILDAMKALMVGRTTFIITHRPSALQNCDRCFVVRSGRLEAGSLAAYGPGEPRLRPVRVSSE